MNLVLLGPPGAGKGTIAARISARYGLTHLSTGDMLRAAIAGDTAVGRRARAYVEKGQLVPNEILGSVVEERLRGTDGVILDGYPRTLEQAEFLAGAEGFRIDAVIYLTVPEEEAVRRLSQRRVCAGCGNLAPDAGGPRCEKCGGEYVVRADDDVKTIKERYRVYREHTAPLVRYYRDLGLLVEVDGAGGKNEVVTRVEKALGALVRAGRDKR